MTDGTHSGTVAIYDGSGNLVTAKNFDYYVTGNQGYPSDPSAVQAWVNAHNGSGDYVEINANNLPYSVTDPNATTGQVTATTYANGQQIASGTSTFHISGGGGGGCPTHLCQRKTPDSG